MKKEDSARIERIREMEARMDRAVDAVRALSAAAETYRDGVKDLRALEAYLNSSARREDIEADEAGRLPAGLKRGVLSEDGLYDLLEEDGALRRMLTQLLSGT